MRITRTRLGISQEKLANACGVSRSYLNKVENGTKKASNQLLERLSTQIQRFDPEFSLTLLIDYVRFRFPTTDFKKIIEDILHLNVQYMIHEEQSLYFYQERYIMGDIVLMISSDEQQGVLLEMKGLGCRQFERFLIAQHRTWKQFFIDCCKADVIIKRLDLAINDRMNLLDISELTRKCERGECVSLFNSFKSYRSGKLVHRSEKAEMGETLYLGSFSSDIYFCAYKKDYEQRVRFGILLEDVPVKNRFEIRVKDDRGRQLLNELIRSKDIDKTIFLLINRYIRFVDSVENKQKKLWPLNPNWQIFIGYQREKMRLEMDPQLYTINRTLKWLRRQVAPSMKFLEELDKLQQTKYGKDMITYSKLSDKQEKILKQQSMSVEELIC